MKPIYLKTNLGESTLTEIEAELLALEWETKRTARHEYFMAESLKKCKRCDNVGATPESTAKKEACPVCNAAGLYNGYIPTAYSYGRQEDGITYLSKPFSQEGEGLRCVVAGRMGLDYDFFNGCFLNKYDDQHQHLGWHADDFAGMDPDAPIAVMSFGAEREIWIKPKKAECPECLSNIGPVGGASLGSSWISGDCETCDGSGYVPVKGAVPPEDRYLLERGSIFIMPPGFQDVMYHRIPKHPKPCGWRISLTFRKFL